MDNFFGSLAMAIQQRNWYAVLTQSLMLPEMCATAAYPDLRGPGKSKERYVKWFDEYMLATYHHPAKAIGNGEEIPAWTLLTGNDCYALRCALVHEASSNAVKNKQGDILLRFRFTRPSSELNVPALHGNYLTLNGIRVAQLEIDRFGREILLGCVSWWSSMSPEEKEEANRGIVLILDGAETIQKDDIIYNYLGGIVE